MTNKMLGIGTVQLRMFNGTMRTLKNVHHVPDLKMSLLSLYALDSWYINSQGNVECLKTPKVLWLC